MILHRPPRGKSLSAQISENPEIARIISRAQHLHRYDWRGYSRLSRQLRRYVGWAATDPALATPDAYEVAHRMLGDAMGSARSWRYHPAKKQG